MSMDGADIIRALRCKDGMLCCSTRGNCKYKYPDSVWFQNRCADWNIRADAAEYIEALEKEVRELRERVHPAEKKPLALFFGDSCDDMVAEMNYLLNVLRCERSNTTAAERVAVLAKKFAEETCSCHEAGSGWRI